MKAVILPGPGGPDVLTLSEVEAPAIRADRDLLIRLKAAGLNPLDTKLRGRGTYGEDDPAILGCDGAGVVEEAGDACSRFRPGDEVYFFNGGIGAGAGNYAEYAVVDERWVAAKPRALSFPEAAAVPLAVITAWESLFDRGGLRSGERALIHSGAGGVGHLAVQLAADAGAAVCTTVGSPEKAELARMLGAQHAIPYREEDFAEAARAWSGGNGVDLAFDTVGPGVLEATFPAVRFFGRAVTLLDPSGIAFKQARLRNLSITLELMLTPMYFGLTQARTHQTQILEYVARMIDDGRLRVHLSRTFPLAQAAEAHRLLEDGHLTGKLALTID